MSDPDRFRGVTVPDPGFSGDTGEVSPEVALALQTYTDDSARFPEALNALSASRVLVPVVAVLGEVEYDDRGLAHDKSSDMAAVLLTGADGRLALLAFTGTEPLTRWNPEARPVPVTAQVAAMAAVQDQADALIVDIAGPHRLVVEGDDLRGLAAGHRLVKVGDDWGWLVPRQLSWASPGVESRLARC